MKFWKNGGVREGETEYVKGKRRRRRRVAAILILATALGLGVAEYWRRQTTRPIDVESASSRELVGWLALRDLSVESPETRARLFDKYVGAISTATADGETRIELPPSLKRFSGVLFVGRDEKLAEWDANRTRPPYWRVDYVVVPKTPRTSEFVLSDDVRPGPALRERWEKSRAKLIGVGSKKEKKSLVAIEKNIKLLTMEWFVDGFHDYDATPDAEKKAFVDRRADELARWQDFYNGLRVSAKLPEAPRAELLREFEATLDDWNGIASVDEVAKALWFKDLIENSLAARETSFRGEYPINDLGDLANLVDFDRLNGAPAARSRNEPQKIDAYPPRVDGSNADATSAVSILFRVAFAVRRAVFVDSAENEKDERADR